jgi:hypothetical protein
MKKRKTIFKQFNIKNILKQQMTTRSDLEFMCDKMGLDNVKINWLKDVDPLDTGMNIINIGNPSIGGTHWIATYNGRYFDSFGLVPPEKLNRLEWTPLQIQDIREGYCGNYCLLWLYYNKIGELDQFYNLFDY